MEPKPHQPAKTFTDLLVWRKSYQFVLAVYAQTRRFPQDELYGLTSQLRRASVSVIANIAEGFRRRSSRDKLRFLEISRGSVEECRCYLMLATDLGYADLSSEMSVLEDASRLLDRYSQSIAKASRM